MLVPPSLVERELVTSKFAMRLSEKRAKLLALGAVFLIGGGAIAYLNLAQRSPKSLSPASARLVPQTALATLTFTTDELAWTKLRQFGTADTQRQLDTAIAQWKDRLTLNGYSFKRDIKPWVGDRITLALLPANAAANSPDLPTAIGGSQNWVVVVPIADPLKAKSLLDEGPAGTAPNWEERTYKGVKVRTTQAAGGNPIESAVIGTSWLLLSDSAAGIEQAIDTQKGGRSLFDVSGYRKAATRVESPPLPGKNFAQIYLNIPAATQALEPPANATPGSAGRGSILPLQGSQGLVATALIESAGLRFQGTSWLAPENDLAYSELRNEAGDMPRRLPDDTLVMMSGSNLQQFWQGFSSGNTSPPFFPNPQNLKAGLLTQTGLDLDEDVMPWAAGEFALGILPPVQPNSAAPPDANSPNATGSTPENLPNGQPNGQPDGLTPSPATRSAPLLLLVKTNDRQAAESVWAQLDDVMSSRYRYQVETEAFEGGSVTQWVSPFQGVQFSHGWLPGNVAFFAVGSSAAEAIAPKPNQSLANDRLFQLLTSGAPSPNNGHFYINLAKINTLEGVFPLPQLSPEGATAAIESIGLTTTLNGRTMNYDLYVELAKGASPNSR